MTPTGLTVTQDLQHALLQAASNSPAQPFVVEAESGRLLTYGESLAAVQQVRCMLGEPPRRIALTLPGGIANATLWLAALTGGHLLIPLPVEATDSEKQRITRLYTPDVLVVETPEDSRGFAHPAAVVLTRQAVEAEIAQAPDADESVAPVAGQVAFATSGTTGEPKGVIVEAAQIAWAADQIRLSHRLTPQDRGLTVLPFSHVNAPVVSLCASLMAGSTVVIARHFSLSHFWPWVEEYRITWASIVPTVLTLLLKTEKPASLPGDLRFVRTASAPLPAVRLRAFEEKFGIPVIETYGLTEAASTVVANPVPPGRHKPGSVGLPVGVDLRICAPQMSEGDTVLRDVPPGESGEVCVRGPGVIRAYRGGAGQESFQDGWFRTGDLGYMDDEGYIFLTGRLREVINRGGENIAPREVEEVLLAHPAVHDAVVIGRPDPRYGEVVVAYVVLEHGAPEGNLARDLRRHAAERLSAYKVPVDFVMVDALPRGPNGKINRDRLREREARNGRNGE